MAVETAYLDQYSIIDGYKLLQIDSERSQLFSDQLFL